MTIPNADKAVITPEKLRDYLLNPNHRRGATKAKLLLSFGYSRDRWSQLESDLHEQHLTQNSEPAIETGFGVRYEISAPIEVPEGRSVAFRSIWQIDTGKTHPRLITMYPE